MVNNLNSTSQFVKEMRNSKDRVIDKKGRDFYEWLEDYEGIILNGRTEGDSSGEWTFVGGMGRSVIDVAVVSSDFIPFVRDLTVSSQIFSDHMPIELKLCLQVTQRSEKEMNLLPKLHWREQFKDRYVERMKDNILSVEVENKPVKKILSSLVEVIYDSYPTANSSRVEGSHKQKHKWFDGECFRARQKSFKLLNLFRKSNDEYIRRSYIKANREFRDLCRIKKQEYNHSCARKLAETKDAKDWWRLVRKFKGNKFVSSENITAEHFASFFRSVFNPPSHGTLHYFAEPFREVTYLDSDFTMFELKTAVARSKVNKAPGLDRIPSEFYKNAPDEFLVKLLRMYNTFFNDGIVPTSFQQQIVFPLYKKGDITVVQNYRAICFQDAIVKLFTSMLLERLRNFVERNNILTEFQAGFRRGYSTVDQLFVLTNIIKIRFSQKRKVYCFFVDFKTAFDRVDRKALFYKLGNLGVSTKYLQILRAMYKNTRAAVWNGHSLSNWFETKSGVKQGCDLSPLAFSLYINDLPDYIGGGININNSACVNVLMYADDIALLAETPQKLQEMIDRLRVYSRLWNLVVNLEKSKIVIFRTGGRRSQNEKWFYENSEIDVLNEYKYLGVTVTSKLSMQPHLKERLRQAKSSINTVWGQFISNNDIALSSKLKIFTAVFRSIMCYGAQVWVINVLMRLKNYRDSF